MMGDAELVTVSCELCGGATAQPLYVGRDRLLGHPGQFPIVRCATCGMVYQSPRPASLDRYYQGDYGPYESTRSTWRPILDRHQDVNQDFTGPAGLYYGVFVQVVPWQRGRLLDVGCASGDFLAAMQVRGWEVAGVEPDRESVRRANLRLVGQETGPVQCGTIELASYPDQSFDVVTLWHVIEHVPSPLATLREVRRVLKPHGICIIQTPAWGSIESQIFGRFWAGLDAPRHLWIFSHLTMQVAAERAGLRIWLRPRATSYPILVLSLMFLASALVGRQRASALFHWLHSGLVERVGTMLMRPLESSAMNTQLTVALVRSDPDPSQSG
jgi:2-polyprenyl-3-methyl-5-hydroxy-6-metoxy-1,4-benzoquinol methylase